MHKPEELPKLVNNDQWLVYRGRYVDTTFLLNVGDSTYLVVIHRGRIESLVKGPFVMPRCTFALRASRDTWGRFWALRPKPGYHDIMALIKANLLKLEGDQYPFMANLLYFKDVLASLRGGDR